MLMDKWCLLLLLFCSVTLSQPMNDLCANAIVIPSLPFSYSGSTVGSSRESTCARTNNAGDVWFSFTPTVKVSITISLCEETDYDSFIYLLQSDDEPSCSNYFCYAFNDNSCFTNGPSAMSVPDLLAGVEHFIVVSGAAGATGSYTMTIEAYDNFADAEVIPSLPYLISDSITPYGSAYPFLGIGALFTNYADWYEYTSPVTVSVYVSTCNPVAVLDTALVVGKRTDLARNRAINNDGCPVGRWSALTTTFIANVQYYICVSTAQANQLGPYTLVVNYVPSADDECPGANVITQLPF